MEKQKRELSRITINVPSDLLRDIDIYAFEKSITRTTAIALICREYFERNSNKKN